MKTEIYQKIFRKENILLVVYVLIITVLLYPFIFLLNHHFGLYRAITKYDLTLLIKSIIFQYALTFKSLLQSFIGSVLIVCSLVFFSLRRKKVNIHGDARFANDKEVKKFTEAKNGIIIGIYKNKLLRFSGQQFVALGAPTRSGKGVGIVIPNLLEQEDSMVVMDIPKLEAFTITSKYRKEVLGQDIFLFSPFKKGTSKYNPLDYVDFTSGVADIQLNAIANIIYVNTGGDDYFVMQARELFVGLALLFHDLIEKGLLKAPYSISTLLECSTIINNEPFEEYYDNVKLQVVLPKGAILRIERYLNTSDNTRSSIKSSFEVPLALFGSDIIAENTSASDFNLNNLRKKKMTIYIGLTLEELLQAKSLINLFFSQLLTENTRQLPEQDPSLKHACVLLLDEFTSIGQIEILKKGCAFIAGYNLRMITIFQGISQLEESPPAGYGKEGAKSLLVNHACQIIYAPKEESDAEEYSKRLGYQDVIDNNVSRSSKDINKNFSEVKQRRALMLPQEIKELPFEEEIIFIENCKPIKCNKAFYFAVPQLLWKLKQVSPTLMQIEKPNKSDFDRAFQRGETKIKLKELVKNAF
ncbi:MAG: TraM recognition domain-containing protein [Neisseriaceae bacterium]|nr:MAG: TraM recognition domain-containing protein [Neisseriaceae bacterium]